MARRIILVAAFLALMASATAMAYAAAGAPGPTIDITQFAFAPAEITVEPGTTVTWVNHDQVPHAVASADKAIASKALDTDDRFAHTFDRSGDYAYYCTLHPFMTGVVHVRKP
jgi:plastocyanin